MEQPEMFQVAEKVCLLKRSLYGLRQAGRVWFETLNQGLTSLQLKEFGADRCCYYTTKGEKILILTIYVDDFLIFSNDPELKTEIVTRLGKIFPIKDLGNARYCLGIRITQRPEGKVILLDQKENISRVLKRFNMADCKPVVTPSERALILTKRTEDEAPTEAPYREAVGCLIHLAQTTRPDIRHAVGVVSQFCADPTNAHWSAVKRIMRYLKGTVGLQLKFDGKVEGEIKGLADADWGGCQGCRKSTTGYVFLLAGACVSWASKKQPTVALSTSEAEYMACSAACQEIKWLLNFSELPSFTLELPMILLCDNQGAVFLSASGDMHKRSKHIDLRHHFVRDMVKEGSVKLEHVSTESMIADVLTKSLTPEKFRYCRGKLGLC